MKTIGELFERPIDRLIEEVIKVEQANEEAVRTEIEEYVVTDSIRDQFAEVYRAIAEGPVSPREGIGVWVSGFFGSGKSSFAKLLGYTVAGRKVGESTAPVLFKRVLRDDRISALLDSITTRIPFQAVIFDVSMDWGVRFTGERLTEIMYRALLRELGYAEDFDLAELEITLEADGRLERFEKEFQVLHGEPWRKRRQMGLAVNEAGTVLCRMDPKTYPAADSYAAAVGRGRADIDPNRLAKRAFDLAARRAPGKALIFIIDEVGQYVSRSVDKMLDLQAIIQAFGVEGRNRTERRQAVSPFWIVVTSQEKLSEVVTALDSRKIELARLQDRFRITIDLKQNDIAEVTAQRVLAKKKAADEAVGALFERHSGRIHEFCSLERSARNLDIDRKAFVRLYPYLPYQIDLCIDIVAGLRLKRGAHRHIGGSNRTIIKQAQQMMINERTRLADRPIGDLVTLDLVYELLEAGNLLPSETTQEVARIAERLGNPLASRVAKAIALLEVVKDLPRTTHNLAVVLYPSVGVQPLRKEIEAALAELEKAQFVRQTEDGYKLLTVQEKSWETRRNGLEPREADRHRLHREVVGVLMDNPKIRSYRYADLRGFRLSLSIDGQPVSAEGDLPFNLLLSSPEELKAILQEARESSAARRQELFWVAALGEPVRTLVTELYRSREMIGEFERLAAQQKLTSEEAVCLADEKTRRDRLERELRAGMLQALQSGVSFFQGVQADASSLGRTLAEMLAALLDRAVPVLYPKLEVGVLPLSGEEAEKLLTSANLDGLPAVFYSQDAGRALLVKQAAHHVPNLGCELCRELVEYLRREHAYGNKVTGKMLEKKFGGIGYGWNTDAVRLGLAVLFRGGAVEVSHQGRKYRHYTEPPARPPFSGTQAFRAASFAPREALDLKVLTAAARMYEELTGRDVNIEEGEIAAAFKQVASADREELLPASARLRALRLPGAEAVQSHLEWAQGILELPPDDCVRTLAQEGATYRENRRLAVELAHCATDENVEAVQAARRVLAEQWPPVEKRAASGELAARAEELEELLAAADGLKRVAEIRAACEPIAARYRELYEGLFARRGEVYTVAMEAIKGRPEWLALAEDPAMSPQTLRATIAPLQERAEAQLDLPPFATVCRRSRATLDQLESDIAAVQAMAAETLGRVLALAAPEERIERVSVARIYPARISSREELERFLAELRDRLEKALASGATIVLE